MRDQKIKNDNILIVAYYFPPLTGAPSWRPYSWARFFVENDLYPTILTRHWTGKETSWGEHVEDIDTKETLSQHELFDVYHLPSKKSRFYNFFNTQSTGFVRRSYFTLLHFFGFFNTEVNAYLTFKKKLKELLKTNRFGTVIFTGPPPNIYRLVNIAKKYKEIKVILDFRDLSNNSVISKSEVLSIKSKFTNILFDYYQTRWMNKSDLIITVTPAFQKYLQRLTTTNVEIIYNGYDNDYFDTIKKENPDKFTVSLVGAIYPLQNYKMILDGLTLFLKLNINFDIQINCIGVLMDPEVALDFKSQLDNERVLLSTRVTKEEAVKYVKNSHCLLFTAWDNIPGMIPAKFYDYLASGTFIINCPGDNDIIDQIIKDSGTGVTLNHIDQLVETLQKHYHSRNENKMAHLESQNEVIAYFSRRNQARLIASLIRKMYQSTETMV